MRRIKFSIIMLIAVSFSAHSQTIDGAYVKALYKQYPTQKSDFCPSCKVWVNPYYRSIADTVKHMPVVTFYIYTRAHRLLQESANIPRTGQYASWHPAYGQPDETGGYRYANTQSTDMIAKGHCQAWILLAWCADAAILSDTYTFNAGMEYQGQNIGTEIATEELCRKLTGYNIPAVTDSVMVWCGTFGSQKTYTANKLTITVPTHYYKILQYRLYSGELVSECYWMPNLSTEERSLLPQRVIDHATLIEKLGFDPMIVFNSP